MAEAPRTKIRVFHLIKGLGRGGAEMLLLEGRRAGTSGAGGAERFLYGYGYLLPWKDALVDPLRRTGAEVVCFGPSSSLLLPWTVWKVIRFLRRWQADLVHAHLPVAGVVARLATRIAGIPLVYTEHNLHERYHPLTRRLNLWTWPFQERVVAVSGQVRESIFRHAEDRVPVEVVRNGIPLGRFRPDPQIRRRRRQELGIPDDAVVVGTTAVFRPQKRLEDWLRAARALVERNRETGQRIRFLLVGDGPLRASLERQADESGLGEHVLWVGLRDDVRPDLAAMDVYLSSSDFEGLPLALLEAMALELPAVATAVGGVPEVVVPEETGVLVAPQQPDDLAEAVQRLIESPELRRRMGCKGRRRVETSFGIDRMTRRLEAIYCELLPPKREACAEESHGVR